MERRPTVKVWDEESGRFVEKQATSQTSQSNNARNNQQYGSSQDLRNPNRNRYSSSENLRGTNNAVYGSMEDLRNRRGSANQRGYQRRGNDHSRPIAGSGYTEDGGRGNVGEEENRQEAGKGYPNTGRGGNRNAQGGGNSNFLSGGNPNDRWGGNPNDGWGGNRNAGRGGNPNDERAGNPNDGWGGSPIARRGGNPNARRGSNQSDGWGGYPNDGWGGNPNDGWGGNPNDGWGGNPNDERAGNPNDGWGGSSIARRGGNPNARRGSNQSDGWGGYPNDGWGGNPNDGWGGNPNDGWGGNPNDGWGGNPNAGKGGNPNDGWGGNPNARRGGNPNAGRGGNQSDGWGGNPNDGWGGNPNAGKGGNPNAGRGGSPNDGWRDNSNAGRGGNPNDGRGGNPNARRGGNPNARRGGIPNAGRGGNPNDGWGGNPNDGWEGNPNDGLGGHPNARRGGNPNDGSGGNPNDGWGGNPNDGKGGNPNAGRGGNPNAGRRCKPTLRRGGNPNDGWGGNQIDGSGGNPNDEWGGNPNARRGGNPNTGKGGYPNARRGDYPNSQRERHQHVGGRNPTDCMGNNPNTYPEARGPMNDGIHSDRQGILPTPNYLLDTFHPPSSQMSYGQPPPLIPQGRVHHTVTTTYTYDEEYSPSLNNAQQDMFGDPHDSFAPERFSSLTGSDELPRQERGRDRSRGGRANRGRAPRETNRTCEVPRDRESIIGNTMSRDGTGGRIPSGRGRANRRNLGACVSHGMGRYVPLQRGESMESLRSIGGQSQYEDIPDMSDFKNQYNAKEVGQGTPPRVRRSKQFSRGNCRGSSLRRRPFKNEPTVPVSRTKITEVEEDQRRGSPSHDGSESGTSSKCKLKPARRRSQGDRKLKQKSNGLKQLKAELAIDVFTGNFVKEFEAGLSEINGPGATQHQVQSTMSGREHIETLSLGILKNMLKEYKGKKAPLKKEEPKDVEAFSELTSIIQACVEMKGQHTEESSNSEEKVPSTVKEESSTDLIDVEDSEYEDTEDSDTELVVRHSDTRHKQRVVSSLFKDRMQFHPKADRCSEAKTKVSMMSTKSKTTASSPLTAAAVGNKDGLKGKQDSSFDDMLSKFDLLSEGEIGTSSKLLPLSVDATSNPSGRSLEPVKKATQKKKKEEMVEVSRGNITNISDTGDKVVDVSGVNSKVKERKKTSKNKRSIVADVQGKQDSKDRYNVEPANTAGPAVPDLLMSEYFPTEKEVLMFLVKSMRGYGKPGHILKEMGHSVEVEEVEKWFRCHSKWFSLFQKDGKIFRVQAYHRNVSYCMEYTRAGRQKAPSCSKETCLHFHICKNLLSGHCQFGERCKFSHDSLDDRNLKVAAHFGLNDVFDASDINVLLSLRFPVVCKVWNTSEEKCPDEQCTSLHLCKNFILGNCLLDDCPKSHSFETAHNNMILKAYKLLGLLTSNNVAMLKKLILLYRTDFHQEKETPEQIRPEGLIEQQRAEKEVNVTAGICPQFLEDKCKGGKCPYYHPKSGLPYLWQVEIKENWINLGEQGCLVEQDYCDVYKEQSGPLQVYSNGQMFSVTMEFSPRIQGYLTSTEECTPINVRRVSTPSFADEECKSSDLKTQWRWYWIDDIHWWTMFDSDNVQYTLETKFQAKQSTFLYPLQNYKFMYCLDFRDMTQTNLTTQKIRQVCRRPLYISTQQVANRQYLKSIPKPVELTVLPRGWKPWDHSNPFELVNLDPKEKEYIEVEEDFHQTLDRQQQAIEKIYRVQNPALWSAFCQAQSTMSVKAERAGLGSTVEQLKLFHGTDRLEVVQGICTNCFDPRICGKNATVYGEGAYFAKKAKYSHGYTSGEMRYMFRARVLAGEYTRGGRSYKRPPEKPHRQHELYDSCVDNTENPTIFIVFETRQSYPEYMIQYRQISLLSAGKSSSSTRSPSSAATSSSSTRSASSAATSSSSTRSPSSAATSSSSTRSPSSAVTSSSSTRSPSSAGATFSSSGSPSSTGQMGFQFNAPRSTISGRPLASDDVRRTQKPKSADTSCCIQ